ncbi:MAG: hypothetical protein NC095_12035, partial [Muribaculum sp.]|nr:hypothetical protein [Muribaculum sp.]
SLKNVKTLARNYRKQNDSRTKDFGPLSAPEVPIRFTEGLGRRSVQVPVPFRKPAVHYEKVL